MAGMQDFVAWQDDFLGARTFVATADSGSLWFWKKTGSPTAIAAGTPAGSGEIVFAIPATNEAENSSLTWNDKLGLDVTKLRSFEVNLKFGAALPTGVLAAIGLGTAAADDPTAITNFVGFRVVGDGASNKLICRTSNATLTTNVASTKTVSTSYVKLKVDLSDRKNVKFYAGGERILTNQVFDWSATSGSVQPHLQIGKAASTATASMTVDYVSIESVR